MAYVHRDYSKESVVDLNKLIDTIHQMHPVVANKHLHWVHMYAMYQGYHYLIPDWDDRRLREANLDRDVRSIYNMIGGYVDTFVAKLLKDEPVPSVGPLSFEQEDIHAARTGGVAFDHWWDQQNCSAACYDMSKWAAITGTGFLKVFWQKNSGEQISLGRNYYDQGEIVEQVVSPFNIFPDPYAKDMKSCRWIIETYSAPIDSLKETYPEVADKIKADVAGDEYQSILSLYTRDTSGVADAQKVLGEESCLVREYWERGRRGHDAGFGVGRGKLVIRAGGQTLYEGANPYKDKLPYFRQVVRPLMDSFWGKGLVDGILTPQHDLNRVSSLLMENIDWMANVKWAVPYGANVEPGALNKDSGEIIYYDGSESHGPHQMGIAPIPAHVFKFRDLIEQAMMHIVGLHEISFAQMPANTSHSSGRVFDHLLDAESRRFAPEIRSLKEALEDMAHFVLELMQKFYTSKRLVSLYGKSRGLEVQAFVGSDLKGNFGIKVDVGKGIGMSSASKTEKLMMLWDRGFIQDPKLIMDNLEFGTIDRVFYDQTRDEANAWRQLKNITELGKTPAITPYDNHGAIIKVFTDFIRSPQFEACSERQRGAIEAVVDAHMQYAQPPAAEQGGTPPSAMPTQGGLDESLSRGGMPPMKENM